jgi:hypothetical protein
MQLRLVAAATGLLCALACTKDFNDTIACSSDYNCPTGYHCATGGKCQTGEASVQVSWVSPADATAMRGPQTFSVKVGHPDGVSSVSLLNGTAVVATKSVGLIGASVLEQVDLVVDTSTLPNGNVTLTAQGTSAKGQTGGGAPRAFLIDNHESAPTLLATTPASPNNAAATTFALKGTADVGADKSLSTVYVFTDPACNGGNLAFAVAHGAAASFIEPGLDVPVIANADTTYYALSVDAVGNVSACSSSLAASGSLTFTNFQTVAVPAVSATTPATPSNTWTSTITATGGADPTHPSTVYVYINDATCGGAGFPAGAATSGTSTDFQTTGFALPYAANTTTRYFARATDVEGNVSGCSGAFAFVSNRSSFCASTTVTPAQVFDAVMQGCSGKGTFANRASLCAPGCRACGASEYVAHQAGVAPTHHYWTNDPLTFSTGQGPCGTGFCGTGVCYASNQAQGTSTQTFSCDTANGHFMRVCTGTGTNVADPEGNTCTWANCGYNSIAPNFHFGGCSGANDVTAGTLCCCGQTPIVVDAGNGNDSSPGSAAAPFKTLTKALSVAVSGQQVNVRPGTYDAANGESFPLNVPGGVILLGDEATRGAGPPVTKISGSGPVGGFAAAVVPSTGATIAGFTITTNGANNAMGVEPSGSGVTIRNNTIVGSHIGVYVINNTTNHQILLNTITGNASDGIGYIITSAGGKAESNLLTGNAFGVEFDSPGGDMGGGAGGSVGNNILSCNTGSDIWAQSAAMTASNNKWDHAPPTTSTSDTRNGLDLFTTVAGNVASANTGASVAPGTICP